MPKKPNALRAWSYTSNIMIVMGCLPAVPLSLLFGEFTGALGAMVVLGAAVYDVFNCHALYESVAERSATVVVVRQRLRRMRSAQVAILVIGAVYFSLRLFSIDEVIARQLGSDTDIQMLQQAAPEISRVVGNLKPILVILYATLILVFVSGQAAILLAYSRGGQRILSYIQEISQPAHGAAQIPPIIHR